MATAPATVRQEASGASVESPAARRALGQVLTPEPIADFMASLFDLSGPRIRALDAGAGAGALTHALVRRLAQRGERPKAIDLVAYEVDAEIIPRLRATLDRCAEICAAAGIDWTAEVRPTDFVADALSRDTDGFFGHAKPRFDAAIVNPPYLKIRSDSRIAEMLRSSGVEVTNLYAAFLAMIARQLDDGGELVAITPRSFCNGPYFRGFRAKLLAMVQLRRLHLFESRRAAFGGNGVLQENIIFHATRRRDLDQEIVLSSSHGIPGDDMIVRRIPYAEAVSPSDPDQIIHFVVDERQARARQAVAKWEASLDDLGMDVSTGRVVDFRSRSFLRPFASNDCVPLIHPCHVKYGYVEWPGTQNRKPVAILRDTQTEGLMAPRGCYVLLRRFTAKEERRRIVAAVLNPAAFEFDALAFENHVNFFHHRGGGLNEALARGLTVFLNSTAVDVYFRQFNGHTQVNAADLRMMRYPPADKLRQLGDNAVVGAWSQAYVDDLVEKGLGIAP